MDIETSQALEDVRTDLRDVEVRISAEMKDLRSEFRDGLAQNRRHAEVLAEAVRDDIRVVAEGVAALTAKVDSLSDQIR